MSQDEDSLVHTGNIADINTVIFRGDHRYTYVQTRLSHASRCFPSNKRTNDMLRARARFKHDSRDLL